MKRKIENYLINWKDDISKKPLLIRGARQVGKTFIVEAFGKKYFKNTITVNFEYQPELKSCFSTFNPDDIMEKLSFLTGEEIIPGKTLLFLDEIQECHQAITALRYFKEKKPTLHVIGAGSLLEFTLNSEQFKMPVGRIQFLFMYPLSFSEFLNAIGEIKLIEYLKAISFHDIVDKSVHKKLLSHVKTYISLGGMPEVINSYITQKNILKCQRIQSSITSTFRNDFGKYGSKINIKYLQQMYDVIPRLFCRKFKYTDIDRETRSYLFKEAINLLEQARVIAKINSTSASGLPLKSCINHDRYKLLFLDVGLLQNANNLNIELSLSDDILLINRGLIAEQFVGQELLAYSDFFNNEGLYYWERPKRNSSAEIDYVANVNSDIFPIEVKAGSTGKLKSLKIFIEEKGSKVGVRISQHELNYNDNILSIPLYLIDQLPRLIRLCTKKL